MSKELVKSKRYEAYLTRKVKVSLPSTQGGYIVLDVDTRIFVDPLTNEAYYSKYEVKLNRTSYVLLC